MNQTLALWSLFGFGIVAGAVATVLAGLWFLWDDCDPFGGEPVNSTGRSRWLSGTNAQSTYTEDETAWLAALSRWKQRTRRLLPNATELIELLEGLGYVRAAGRLPPAELDRGLALYRKQTGRCFPTFTETLALMQAAGYRHRE